ncbi:hypothetical protein LguiA_005824 [Lonicera macranthoides]
MEDVPETTVILKTEEKVPKVVQVTIENYGKKKLGDVKIDRKKRSMLVGDHMEFDDALGFCKYGLHFTRTSLSKIDLTSKIDPTPSPFQQKSSSCSPEEKIPISLCGHTSPVESLAFDSAEVLVAAGASAGVIKLWDLEETKEVRTLTGHKSYCSAVEFHPFGHFFASGSMDTNLDLLLNEHKFVSLLI